MVHKRIFQIWDLASGKLRLSLTGHVSAVRACKVSHRHPFLFTGGEDKQVMEEIYSVLNIEYTFIFRQIFRALSFLVRNKISFRISDFLILFYSYR